MGEGQRRVAERRAQFEDAARLRRRGQHAEQRAVPIRIGVAAMAGAMLIGGLAHVGERIGRRLRHRRLTRGSDNSGFRA